MKHTHQHPSTLSPKHYHQYKQIPKNKNTLISLLKHCKIAVNQISKLEQIDDDKQILNKTSFLLKNKFDQLEQINDEINNRIQELNLQNQQSQQKIKQFSQHSHQLKSKQASLKLIVQSSQKQWQDINEILHKTRVQLDELDDQLFKKSKECSDTQQQNKMLQQNIQLLTRQLKHTTISHRQKQREFEKSVQKIKLERFQIFKILQIKQQQIQQLELKNNYTQQQYEFIERQYLRWKQRCQLEAQNYKDMKAKQAQENVYQNNKKHKQQQIIEQNDMRVKQLYQQIRELSQKFRQAIEQKNKLYADLDQIKQLLLVHGIDYDKFEDAPLIQIIKRQKGSPKQKYGPYSYKHEYPYF